jgi:hypothetical protein
MNHAILQSSDVIKFAEDECRPDSSQQWISPTAGYKSGSFRKSAVDEARVGRVRGIMATPATRQELYDFAE